MADTYDLDPAVRIEEILNGDDIEPANRLEYFMKKAANEVPKPSADDNGKVPTIENNEYVLKDKIIERGSGAKSVVIDGRDLSDDVEYSDPIASGKRAIAIGVGTEASGLNSLAIGAHVTASGQGAIALGSRIGSAYGNTMASASNSFAWGGSCKASAVNSMALGQITEANASASLAFGLGTKATGRGCVVIGINNIPDDNPVDTSHGAGARKYLFIIGNGIFGQEPSNALTVDWEGNIVCHNIPAPPSAAGSYTLKCTVDASGNASYSWA